MTGSSPDEVEIWRGAVGSNIRLARSRAGLSQGALARAVGVSRPAISRLEAGDFPTLELLYRIARALQTHPGMLLTVDSDPFRLADLVTSVASALRE